VRNPNLVLDGPDARNRMIIRRAPQVSAAHRVRWNMEFQRKLEQLDDEGNMAWQSVAEYRYLLADYLRKRRCRTATYMELHGMWQQMVAHHEMLLGSVGDDAVRLATQAAAADADSKPCG
jgi:hypothetical protein